MSMSFLGFTVAVYIQDLVLKKLATQTTPRSIDERLFTLYRGPGNGNASKKENSWTLSTLPQSNVIKKKKILWFTSLMSAKVKMGAQISTFTRYKKVPQLLCWRQCQRPVGSRGFHPFQVVLDMGNMDFHPYLEVRRYLSVYWGSFRGGLVEGQDFHHCPAHDIMGAKVESINKTSLPSQSLQYKNRPSEEQ